MTLLTCHIRCLAVPTAKSKLRTEFGDNKTNGSGAKADIFFDYSVTRSWVSMNDHFNVIFIVENEILSVERASISRHQPCINISRPTYSLEVDIFISVSVRRLFIMLVLSVNVPFCQFVIENDRPMSSLWKHLLSVVFWYITISGLVVVIHRRFLSRTTIILVVL